MTLKKLKVTEPDAEPPLDKSSGNEEKGVDKTPEEKTKGVDKTSGTGASKKQVDKTCATEEKAAAKEEQVDKTCKDEKEEQVDKTCKDEKEEKVGKTWAQVVQKSGGGASSSTKKTPPPPPPPKRVLDKRAEVVPGPPDTPEAGTWVLKQNSKTRVAVDWHNVMEINEEVSLYSIRAVQSLLKLGYQVFLVSYCGPWRQAKVHPVVQSLPFEFTAVKYLREPTGVTGKAHWCKKNQIGHIFDDGAHICREAEELGIQAWPIRTKFEKHPWTQRSFFSLDEAVEDFLEQEFKINP